MRALPALIFLLCAMPAWPETNIVDIEVTGDQRCITSNATPDHEIGVFPNPGNPQSFRAQRLSVCVDATPEKGAMPRPAVTSGISLTGILFRPGTADWYDPDSPRGFSRDSQSGWNLEGMGAAEMLGLDENHAHVDQRGLYHYHALPAALSSTSPSTLVGYAADGFEIHWLPEQATSSWRLKPGMRATPPNGSYDGTFVEDWQFVAGAGTLDRCNGAMLNGRYVYFATTSYPFFPRCF